MEDTCYLPGIDLLNNKPYHYDVVQKVIIGLNSTKKNMLPPHNEEERLPHSKGEGGKAGLQGKMEGAQLRPVSWLGSGWGCSFSKHSSLFLPCGLAFHQLLHNSQCPSIWKMSVLTGCPTCSSQSGDDTCSTIHDWWCAVWKSILCTQQFYLSNLPVFILKVGLDSCGRLMIILFLDCLDAYSLWYELKDV